MSSRFVFCVIAAATCLVSAGLYVDEAVKAFREDDKWNQAFRAEMPSNEAVPESKDIQNTE